MKKLFNIALMIVVAYMFILLVSTVEAQKVKRKKRYIRPGNMINVCTPKVAGISQIWSSAQFTVTASVNWSCVGSNNQPCSIYIVAHIYKDGMPYPPDDPINFKINNIWSGSDGLACGYGKMSRLIVFLGNIPPGNYSSEVSVYVGNEQIHGYDSLGDNTYNWTVQ